MSTQWSAWPWVITTALSSAGSMCCCRLAKVPLPQSIQMFASPARTRYPLHAPPAGAPYEPEHPSTVSSTTRPPPPRLPDHRTAYRVVERFRHRRSSRTARGRRVTAPRGYLRVGDVLRMRFLRHLRQVSH